MDGYALLCFAAAVCGACLAGFVWLREERSPVRLALAWTLLLVAADSALSGWALYAEGSSAWLRWRFTVLLYVPACLFRFSLGYARGDVVERLERWRVVGRVLVLGPVAIAVWLWTRLRPEWGGMWLGWPEAAVHLYFMGVTVFALAILEQTLRGAMGVMRWRVKYMVIGLAVLFVARLYTSSREVLFGLAEGRLLAINALALIVGSGLILLALRRGKLRSVDLYLSQHVLYRSVTLMLAGAYLVVVGGLTRVAYQLGMEPSALLTALVTLVAVLGLVVILLSDRLRQQVKRLVSRHFVRPEHDYRREWTRFARQAGSVLDVPVLCRSVARLVSETFEALSVSIWTVDTGAGRLKLGASTALSGERARELSRPEAGDTELLAGLGEAEEPFLVDESSPAWARTLQVLNPDSFPRGAPVCVPLQAGGQLLGAMMVGDRVNGRGYTLEDFDLLRTIGDQVAASLYTSRLAGQLLEAREFEAFQTMSAFFVHDLKNTTSTLALMMQNLPAHFEDAAFREDALRSMGKAVERMKDLIRRLTVLRRSLELHPQTVQPHDLVRHALAGLDKTPAAAPHLDLQPVPEVVCDPDQVQTVLTNLILNARDAIGDDGEIWLATAPADGGVEIRVRDNGPGMTPEFVANSLFKPFRSTKKEGMGIGLFHSRMIMEAHHGSLRVDSRPGEGTTFHIYLPIRIEGVECVQQD